MPRVLTGLPVQGEVTLPPAVVAIGNFDGVHAGHRRLFRRVVALARENGWTPSALTFDPHPSKVVAPARAPRLLTTTEQRAELIAAEGIEQIFVLPFDRAFASLGPEEFVERILVHGIHAKAVLVGDNFRFGSKQAGDVGLLRKLGAELGFIVEVAPMVSVRNRAASSTEVRTRIEGGEVSQACRLLERPYELHGSVVSGAGIGSKQTVPTLNLKTDAEVIPRDGVYITQTVDAEDGRTWDSITNIGIRPTFNGQARTVETFLLSAFDGRPPNRMRLRFLKRVRDERKFDSPEALKTQILRDVKRAQTYFRRVARWSSAAKPVC